MIAQRLISLTVMLVVCGSAFAQKSLNLNTNTAADLADLCTARAKEAGGPTKRSFCQGFAQGVISVETLRAGGTKPFCFPQPAPTRGQAVTEFASWVGNSPERRAMPSSEALMRFLADRHPCKAAPQKGQ